MSFTDDLIDHLIMEMEAIDMEKGTDGVFRQKEAPHGITFGSADIPIFTGVQYDFVLFDEAQGSDETVYQRRSLNGQTTTRYVAPDWKQSRDPVALVESIRRAAGSLPYAIVVPFHGFANRMDMLLAGIPILRKPYSAVVGTDSGRRNDDDKER